MALFFDASGETVNLGNTGIESLAAISIVGLVRRSTTATFRRIISKETGTAGWRVYNGDPSTTLAFAWTRDSALLYHESATGSFPVNTWMWFAATCDQSGPEVHLYLADLQSALSEVSYNEQSNGSGAFGADGSFTAKLARRGNTNNDPWVGEIARIAVYDRVLSLAELQEIQADWKVLDSTCKRHLLCGFNGGTDQPDDSGTVAPMTITGATVAQDPPIGRARPQRAAPIQRASLW